MWAQSHQRLTSLSSHRKFCSREKQGIDPPAVRTLPLEAHSQPSKQTVQQQRLKRPHNTRRDPADIRQRRSKRCIFCTNCWSTLPSPTTINEVVLHQCIPTTRSPHGGQNGHTWHNLLVYLQKTVQPRRPQNCKASPTNSMCSPSSTQASSCALFRVWVHALLGWAGLGVAGLQTAP
jgi:hypothetical protein